MPRILLVLTALAIWIYGIIDVTRTHDTTRFPGRLKKPAWLALTIFLPTVGSLLWIIFTFPIKFPAKEISLGGNPFSRYSPSKKKKEPVAPDDDIEFLKKIDSYNRFREWEREQEKKKDSGESDSEKNFSDPDDKGPVS